MLLKGKTVVVTGGGNGVGRELTIQLIARGARVIAVDIKEEALNETKQKVKIPKNMYSYVVDISKKDQVYAFQKKVLERFKHVDILINNAGVIQPFVSAEDLEYETIERVMNINFYGTLYMIKAFLPSLKKRKSAYILNVSSMGGFLPVPGQSIYGASKAAVKLLTEALHSELIGTNVKVGLVLPGGMSTNIAKNSGAETAEEKDNNENSAYAKIILSPQKAVHQMLEMIENEKFVLYLGKDSKLMHAIYKLNPNIAMSLIQKAMKNM